MARGNSKKRRRVSPTSSVSSTPAPTKNRSHPHKKKNPEIVELENSEEESLLTDQDNPIQSPKGLILTDEQQLKRAMVTYRNQKSSAYASYDPPTLSDAKDKNGCFMIVYRCKTCGNNINRPIYDSSPSNISKHLATCAVKIEKQSKDQGLAAVGVSGTGDVDAQEVPQLCAVWCAEAARPFSALGERSHKGIMHPMVVHNLPTQKAVSNDIGQLYTAVQEGLIKSLKDHKGAMYLGLDAWQSPNGFDALGTVLYRLVEGDGIAVHLEAMPLDFVQLQKSHTGYYLAETVRAIVEKFGIKDKICGIVTDNASNNGTMIKTIESYCYLTTLWKPQEKRTIASTEDYSDKGEDYDDPDEDIQLMHEDTSDVENEDLVDDEDVTPADALAADLINDDEIELEDDDVHELSEEEDNDCYTSISCKATLVKFQAISRKLNKSPNSRARFVELCQDHECLTPHNVQCDVRTRWNSTLIQLTCISQCSAAILEWQRDKRHGPAREHHINQDDLELAKDLVEVLQPFYEITLQVSTRGVARISDIVVFIDQITGHLSSAISERRDEYPPALRNACRAGLQLTNKYYTLTDCSPLYRVAMVLHPSFKDGYFKLAKWKPEWINEAIRLTREMWESHYKPLPPQLTTSQPPNPCPSQPKTGVLVGLAVASEAQGTTSPTDPLQVWLAGGLALTEDGRPVNPLKWWMQQRRAGNTHGGLLQMALDVLSCPATTVDVERSFSFGRDYVSFRRHRLTQNSEDSLPSQFSFLAPFPRSTNIGERSDSYLTCAGLLSTIKHEKIKYKIINALTDLDGTDGPCIGVDSDDEAQIGHAPIINNSPTRVGYFTNLPGSSYVLRLDPGKDGFLHFNMDYPWVLASADPKANLNKEMYELIVPRALTENPNLIKRLTGFIFNLCNPKAVR
ncbi:hypothetical protein MJO28_007393 [Puccinia striiformis f. sp. tritici]|uniref:Uncharacterized protein n=1 Tax=Puccinia striiformis f. sp. tritici TaxID=168172 RepID=A0ACC0EDX3_9BASI|nr:hypothetical protein MJO28_007393 [Puccinia striiformis f. sp. tritici]